ncbi:MAG: BlaI/MecI/CopY family transcriptional regulator [Planctomycetota bacterium]
MTERPSLSKSEMEVARVLWEIGPATVREIHAAMEQRRPIDFATVQTYLRRIENKGYASSELENRARLYTAAARPKTVIRETVDDLVERLFGGDSMPLVRHLIEERGIGSQEIEELRSLIERLDSEKKQGGES